MPLTPDTRIGVCDAPAPVCNNYALVFVQNVLDQQRRRVPTGKPRVAWVACPITDVRIIEQSTTLTGRLVGLLFADRGAEVFVERPVAAAAGASALGTVLAGEHDTYLDRGKIAVPPGGLADTSSADIIIVDGTVPVTRAAAQIVLRVTAALPGDEAYGHLPADCSEDLLSALVAAEEQGQSLTRDELIANVTLLLAAEELNLIAGEIKTKLF